MTYRLALLSPIAVVQNGTSYKTLDLWAVDLKGQLETTPDLTLICPVISSTPASWQGDEPLPSSIKIIDFASLKPTDLDKLLDSCDVVQVYGGQNWRASKLCRQLVRLARLKNIKSIVGLSSNRARTALMNATCNKLSDVPNAVRALASYISIRASYQWLTSRTDGTFIVGDGIKSLVAKTCPTLHVGIASWIQDQDIKKARKLVVNASSRKLKKLCIASRLEHMKGVHVGIEALRVLDDQDLRLSIFGAGPERDRLEMQVQQAGMSARVNFGGTLAYPGPFLDRLEEHDAVILPNLNDEQPRLVFDAISRGCLPLCPDTKSYVALGIPSALLYRVGDATSMAEALQRLQQTDLLPLYESLFAIGERHTLQSMHSARAEWIISSVLEKTQI